ncbi:GMF family protein [Bisporella sp. PMI_857]|nr:GMF family protein [Bisporella sp. PMI_857]
MASESRLYTFSAEDLGTADKPGKLKKFRLGTSRAKELQAVIYEINRKTLVIKQDEEETVYKTLEDIAEDLPDHSPRFVLLSYPLTLKSGRYSVPYIMLYYMPATCNAELRMLYAGAKELMRNTAEVGQIIELDSKEDIEDIPEKLGAE